MTTPATKAIRKAAVKLVDVMMEAELGSWNGGPTREEHGKIAIDAQMMLADLAMENAAHIVGRRPARIEIREHRNIHEKVLSVVQKLRDDLREIEFADYPGGAKAAELHEVIGHISTLSVQGDKASIRSIHEVCVRANPLISQLPPETKIKLAALVLRLDDENKKVLLPWMP